MNSQNDDGVWATVVFVGLLLVAVILLPLEWKQNALATAAYYKSLEVHETKEEVPVQCKGCGLSDVEQVSFEGMVRGALAQRTKYAGVVLTASFEYAEASCTMKYDAVVVRNNESIHLSDVSHLQKCIKRNFSDIILLANNAIKKAAR